MWDFEQGDTTVRPSSTVQAAARPSNWSHDETVAKAQSLRKMRNHPLHIQVGDYVTKNGIKTVFS